MLKWVPALASLLAGGIGLLGVLRHWPPFPRFIAIAPQLQGIKFNTALSLIALAVALAAARSDSTSARRWSRVAFALIPIFFGCASLAEYVLGIDLKIDELFVRDIVPGYSVPGRMGFNTAACLVLLGPALILSSYARSYLAPIAVVVAGAIAIFSLSGHAFGLDASMRVALLGEMSLLTATAILLLCIGVLSLPATTQILQQVVLPTRFLLAGFVSLMLLLAATAWLYLYLASAAVRLAAQAFSVESTPISNDIAVSLDHATQTLLGARGLFAASRSVSRADWHEYVVSQELAGPQGTMGVGFSEWIEPNRLASHERQVRDEGFHEYQVRPAGVRSAYTAILYLEPFSGQNLRAFGYDMYSDPVRREAMDKAMVTGMPALSAPVQLIQNDAGDTQPGILIYVPVYSRVDAGGARRFLGFAYSPVRVADLARDAVAYVQEQYPRIGFEIVDAAAADRPMFEFPNAGALGSRSLYKSRTILPLGQRHWIVNFYSLPSFESAYRSLGPVVGLYSGISLSVAIVTLAFLLLGYRSKARTLTHRSAELVYQLALNRAVTDQMADPVFLMDLDGRVTFPNAAVERHFGFARAEIHGCPLHGTIHHHHADGSDFPEEQCPIMQSLRGEPLINYETVYLRKGGDRMNVVVSATPLYMNGTQAGAVIVAHDITERKMAEEALIRSNQELQRFAYVASHDLQTPLRSIASFTQLLEDSLHERAKPRELDWMGRIVQNTRKMERLIASLLEYARVGASTRAFVDVDLNRVVANVLETMQPQLLECGAEIVADKLPVVHGEPTQLAQLFQNLIGNAIKYRSALPPQIEIRAEQCGSERCISVKDNGIGIDERFREQIFEPFKRLHTDRHYMGTGVGLAICRRVVERHGGRLWVKSKRDEGSTFYFTLPMHASHAFPARAAS